MSNEDYLQSFLESKKLKNELLLDFLQNGLHFSKWPPKSKLSGLIWNTFCYEPQVSTLNGYWLMTIFYLAVWKFAVIQLPWKISNEDYLQSFLESKKLKN